MAQRGKGEGTISKRADGRWQVRVPLGRGPDGRRRRKYAYAATQGDAVRLLKGLSGRAVGGTLLTTSTPTVAKFLEDWFAANSDRWRWTTRRGYRGAIDSHLKPVFGSLRLEQLSPAVVQRWLTGQKEEYGARRRIALAHAVLRSALSEAQRLQLVTINAAALVKVPRTIVAKHSPLDVEQARVLLLATKAHRLGALVAVAMSCGLRLGEATGLRWQDVDLDRRLIRVRQQLQRQGKALMSCELKTERSRRTIGLPESCALALADHRRRQLEERLKAGARWVDSGLVFVARHGGPLDGRNVLRSFASVLTAAGLPPKRFHDLRHSCASLLIAGGASLVEVQQVLGHSAIRLTADTYGHLLDETAAVAARRMDALLAPAAKR
jgi:integrase